MPDNEIFQPSLDNGIRTNDIIVPPSGGGGLQSLTPGTPSTFSMPEGNSVTVDTNGRILGTT